MFATILNYFNDSSVKRPLKVEYKKSNGGRVKITTKRNGEVREKEAIVFSQKESDEIDKYKEELESDRK